MPKRSYPYEESFESQRKIRVGPRQVNEGTMSVKNMKQVYVHTLNMLYAGSGRNEAYKENTFSIPKNNCNDAKTLSSTDEHPKLPLKQLEITSQGELLRPNNTGNCSKHKQNHFLCKVCDEVLTSYPVNCGYCESIMCESCQHSCLKCHKPFCKACSFVEYKENSDFIICLSCF